MYSGLTIDARSGLAIDACSGLTINACSVRRIDACSVRIMDACSWVLATKGIKCSIDGPNMARDDMTECISE